MANLLLEVENVDVFYGVAQALVGCLLQRGGAQDHRASRRERRGQEHASEGHLWRYSAHKGENSLLGKSPRRPQAREGSISGISHVPEGRRLFSGLTVLENLELGAYLPNVRPLTKESLERVFGLFPVLKNRMRQAAGTLSGGEQQMLAIGRALMARPTLLLLDEPSLGLAPIVVKLLFDIIKVLNRDGVTILLVEQNVRKTLEIADYVFVLENRSHENGGAARASFWPIRNSGKHSSEG